MAVVNLGYAIGINDAASPGQQLKVNADGSINVNATGGGGGGGTITGLVGGGAGGISGAVNTAANPAIIVPAQAGKIISVYRMILQLGPAGSFPNVITIADGVPTLLSGPLYYPDPGASLVIDATLSGNPWYTCTIGQPFQIVNPGLFQLSGTVYYTAL